MEMNCSAILFWQKKWKIFYDLDECLSLICQRRIALSFPLIAYHLDILECCYLPAILSSNHQNTKESYAFVFSSLEVPFCRAKCFSKTILLQSSF